MADTRLGRRDQDGAPEGDSPSRRGGVGLPGQHANDRAQNSYIHPRVIDLYEDGITIAPTLQRAPQDPLRRQERLEKAVLMMLTSDPESAPDRSDRHERISVAQSSPARDGFRSGWVTLHLKRRSGLGCA
ncbi:MAG: hypothetical protein WKF82_10235 [Nocardioidaceae bacterium]